MLDGMKRRLLVGLCAIIILIILTPTASATTYVQTTYTDFIQGNGDGNIVFTRESDGEISLSRQVGTAVGGFRLVGQLPGQNWSISITAARGCLYLAALGDTHVYWTHIAEDGSIGDWYASDPMPYPLMYRPGIAVIGDRVFVIGIPELAIAMQCRLAPDGAIVGQWSIPDSHVGARGLLGTSSGRLYCGSYGRVSETDIDADGGLNGWFDAIDGCSGPGSIHLLNNGLYVIQGSPLQAVDYGRLGDDGTAPLVSEVFADPYRTSYLPATISAGGCLLGFGGEKSRMVYMNGVLSELGIDGTPQNRRNAPPLRISLKNAAAAYWQGYAYVAGGLNPSQSSTPRETWTTDVYAAKLVEDGTPEPWVETTSMPAAVTQLRAIGSDSHLYAIGGTLDAGVSTTVRRAPVLPGGALGTWDDTVPLPEPRFLHAAVRDQETIYVSGGMTRVGGSDVSEQAVWRTTIGTDGSLSPWETLGPLPEPTWGHAMFIRDRYLYCVYAGGQAWKYPPDPPIYSAPILADGSIGDWTMVATVGRSMIYGGTAAATESRLYVYDSNRGVRSAAFVPGGLLGEWRQEAPLPYGINAPLMLARADSVYVVAGWQAFSRLEALYPDVYGFDIVGASYRGTLDAEGRITAWQMLPGTPMGPQYRSSATVIGDSMYILGGAYRYNSDYGPTTNKVFFSRLHTSDTPLPTVSGGRYVGMFRLEQDEPMVSLHWSGAFGEGSGAEVRWRTATEADPTFSPWSEFSAANQIPIGRTASCLQYEVSLTSADGNPAAVDSIRLVTDTAPPQIAINPTPSILWRPNGRLIPVIVNGSATDTESGVASVSFTITDEYGRPCEQVTDFGQTVRLEASRKGNDRDGRVYTVTVRAADYAGNEATAAASIVCPHNPASVESPRR